MGEKEQGGGHFLRKQLAACRATELQDYRGAKMNVTKTTNVHRVAEQGWYHLNSLEAHGTAVVQRLITPQRGNTATCP